VSDFWDDLQRWTEAQVAAILRGRIRAKRKDYLAADINKLLRDRINEPLAIKVGDKVLAEFLRNSRGSIRWPGDGVLEHGWLTYDYAGNTYPLNVFSTDRIAGFFTRNPSEVPIGYDGDKYPSVNWDGNNTNPPIPGASDIPMLYTGLARLWAQGCLGFGIKPSNVLSAFPFSVVFGREKRIGIIRSPSFAYWMVIITSVGTWTWRMVPSLEAMPALSYLKLCTSQTMECTAAESLVLGSATFPDDPVQVKSEAEMMDVYLGGTHQRWDFCDQRIGSAGKNQAKAITAIEKGMFGDLPNKYWTTHLARMRVSFSGTDTPIINFSVTDELDWAAGTGGLYLCYPVDGVTWAWRNEAAGGNIGDSNNALGDDVPIMAWHTPDGDEFIINTGSAASIVTVVSPEPVWVDLDKFCNAGASSGVHEVDTITVHGLTVPNETQAQLTLEQKTYTSNTYTLVGSSAVTWLPQFSVSDEGYSLTFGDALCSVVTIGPFTAEEALALYPGSRVLVGAGTSVSNVQDTWIESGGIKFLFGYYPRTFGYLWSREGRNDTPRTVTQTRLYDSSDPPTWSGSGVISASIGGAIGRYPKTVTGELSAGDTETITVAATTADPEFYAVWVTEHGQRIEDSDPDNFVWTAVDDLNPVISGLWASYSSYGMDEHVFSANYTIHLPVGLSVDSLDYDLGAWIGGA
jgi:hypothetical protein